MTYQHQFITDLHRSLQKFEMSSSDTRALLLDADRILNADTQRQEEWIAEHVVPLLQKRGAQWPAVVFCTNALLDKMPVSQAAFSHVGTEMIKILVQHIDILRNHPAQDNEIFQNIRLGTLSFFERHRDRLPQELRVQYRDLLKILAEINGEKDFLKMWALKLLIQTT